MRCYLYAAIAATALVCASHARAQAMVEFCPAEVDGFHAVVPAGAPAGTPSATYGYRLGALGSRTTSGTVAVDTDHGWFTVPYTGLVLGPETKTYETKTQKFVRTDFFAPTQFARFPEAVVVHDMWVVEASAKGDGPFGWEARGAVPCEPSQLSAPVEVRSIWNSPDVDHPDPAASAIVATNATPADPPLGLDCAHPFVGAHATYAVSPEWPDDIDGNDIKPRLTVDVEVAVDARGLVRDAWVWAPSPYQQINDSAVTAARKSSYAPAIALCHPVPGTYIFRADFMVDNEPPPAMDR